MKTVLSKGEFQIYGLLTDHDITFIGCTKGAIPLKAIRLQTVSDHPEANWVKWCLRFRRTLKDRTGIDHPLAEYFTNRSRVKRLLGDEAVTHVEAEKCKDFLTFHANNPDVLAEMAEQARAEKAAGRTVYAADAHLSGIRWNKDIASERGDDRFKINSTWSAWYSRLIQMAYPDLIGFFRLRNALADGLVIDGRSWRAFAKEHADKLHYDSFDAIPDSDWEHNA
jgi:hypothetical protein